MSALSAAASDEDGDTIRNLRAAIQQACDWISEEPGRRPISAGRLLAILTNALAAAPQPPVVEQEPVAYRHLHEDGWEYYDAPTGSDCDGCQALYTHPQPRQPLTNEQIEDIDGEILKQGHSESHTGMLEFARAIERAHGIGGEA